MACACGAGLPGQGVDPGTCPRAHDGYTAGGHCACVHLQRCPECDRAGWHTASCGQPGSAAPCPVYSHGPDGWHCAIEGPHAQHSNAAGDVTW